MGKLKIPLLLGIALVAIGWLVARGVSRNDIYMTSLDQWDESRARREAVRVAGFVADGSISEHSERLLTDFRLRSPDERVVIPVRYEGVLPDLFRDGANVVVAGKLGEDGVFHATDLMTKCPSKYEGMAAPPAGSPAAGAPHPVPAGAQGT